MTKAPTENSVLIIIPTLGQREEYLRETIESIHKQSYKGFDIALIYPFGNHFVDTLADNINAIKVPDPGGLSAALNAGIAAAKPHHKFISWIGDDDLLTPDSLKYSVDALNRYPHSPVAFGYCDYIDERGKFLFKNRAGSLAPWIMTWGPDLVPLPGALFRKEAIIQVGGFDENNKYTMDLDIFLRLRKIGKFINTKKTLAAFRWHRESMSVASRSRQTDEAETVKRKHTPRLLRPFTPLWFIPTRYASKLAAKRLSNRQK